MSFMPIIIFFSTVIGVMGSESEVVSLDGQSPPLCASRPIEGDTFKVLSSSGFCLQPIIVPKGQVAQIFFTNRQTYCGQLDEEEKSLAQISNDGSSTNFCTAPAPSITLSSGSHYIGVSASSHPLKVSMTYINTHLGCGDKVTNALIGIPLTFLPTKPKCTLLLPGRSELTVTALRRTEGSENSRQCARIRMGKAMYSLYFRFPPICKVDDPMEFDLGCGIVVIDASNRSVQSIDFIVRKMDDQKAFISGPLMCSNNGETLEQIIEAEQNY